MRKQYILALIVVSFALAACGSATRVAPDPTGSPSPTESPAPTVAPTVTPQQLPSATPTESPATPTATRGPELRTPLATVARPTAPPASADTPPDALVRQATRALAQALGIDPATLTVQEATSQEWPSSAIGCPADDHAYLTVITPGYLLTYSDGSTTYDVHTDAEGNLLVLCRDGTPTPLPGDEANTGIAPVVTPALPSGRALVPTQAPAEGGSAPFDQNSQQMTDLAIQALANDLQIDAGSITVNTVEPRRWNDGSLGCPRPGAVYPQVITSGYLIVLETDGQLYEYHTDRDRQVIRCDPGQR